MRTFDHVLAAVASIPWAIEPDKGRVIADILTRRVNGERASDEAIRAAIESRREKPKSRRSSVAMVPLYGVMTQRADFFTELSGMASTETIGRAIDEAAADPNIEAIVMDVDSPGGSVYGVAELGDKIVAAGKKKKVIAVANSEAASAAYWVAAQASELVVTPNGQVGSIGVWTMHVDQSKAIEAAGAVVTLLSAGERKTAGNPYGPLDAMSRDELQAGVDDYYKMFVKAVASGRVTSQAAVREGFGKGGMVRAEQAVKEGMADKVGTLDSILERYGLSVSDVMGHGAERANFAIEMRKRKMLLK